MSPILNNGHVLITLLRAAGQTTYFQKENTVVVILILGAPMKSQDIGNNFLIRGERGVLFLKELTSYIITSLTVNRKVRVVVTGRQRVQFNQKLPVPGVCTAFLFFCGFAKTRRDKWHIVSASLILSQL